MIGANGAGKTTTLMAISGLIKLSSGNIYFGGRAISSLPPEEIVKIGISQCPEGRQIFSDLTVMENLELGCFVRKNAQGIRRDLDKVFDLFPILKGRLRQKGGTLSGGEQQMLAMGRAIMSDPKLLLFDEPSLGLAPKYVQIIFDTIKDFHRKGASILLVEQNAQMALSIANRGYVLETGRIVHEDTAKKLLKNKIIQKSYLGG